MTSFIQRSVLTSVFVLSACLLTSQFTLPVGEPDPCSPLEYKCDDGKCLKSYQICDGYKDCLNKADEDVDMCKARPCIVEPPSIKCNNTGVCIYKSWLCDGHDDCGDASDENVRTCQVIFNRPYIPGQELPIRTDADLGVSTTEDTP